MFGWGSASKGASTRGLYREILRAAQHWPSTRRAKVIEEIRLEFRQNSTEADAAKRDSLLEQVCEQLIDAPPSSFGRWTESAGCSMRSTHPSYLDTTPIDLTLRPPPRPADLVLEVVCDETPHN